MTRSNFPGTPREHRRRRRARLFLAVGGAFLFTLAVLSVFELATGTPVMARAPQVVDIDTPDFGMPVLAVRDGDILPTTPEPLALAGGAGFSPALRPARRAQAPTSTAVPGGHTFEATPQAGPPGTQLTLTGHGWAPDEAITLRLQDAGPSQAMLAEYPLAVTDSGGNFRANYTIPSDPPWGQLPALVLWAVSTKTGAQTRAPQPFLIRNAGAPVVRALQDTVTVTATAAVTATLSATPGPTGEATATPLPAASSPVAAQQAGQPTFVVATLMPSSTPPPTFQSPLPTPEASSQAAPVQLPATAAPAAAAAPRGTPGLLPSSGAPLLATVVVQAGPAALRSQPGYDYLVLMTLGQGTALGVLGQNAGGAWLLVTTSQGVQGWLPAAATNWGAP